MKIHQISQRLITSLLIFVFIFSDYKPFYITAYIMLCGIALSLSIHINQKESVATDENSQSFPQAIIAVLLQLFVIGCILLMTWFLIEKKLL